MLIKKKKVVLSAITSGITFTNVINKEGLDSYPIFITGVSSYALRDHLSLNSLAREVGEPDLQRQMVISRKVSAY